MRRAHELVYAINFEKGRLLGCQRRSKICLGILLALNSFLGGKWKVVGGLISSQGLWFSVWLSIGYKVTTGIVGVTFDA